MIRSLWTARTGLDAQQTNLDVISHNLANVSTSGYKRERVVFEDLLYQTLRQPGAQHTQQNEIGTGLQVGLGVRPIAVAKNFTQGTPQETNNDLDIMINGNGFLQIEMPDGSIAYTRAGNFSRDSQGNMVMSGTGYPLADGINLPQDAVRVNISNDGVVSAVISGQAAPVQVGTIQLAMFINPDGLSNSSENLYTETATSGPPNIVQPGTNSSGTLKQGWIENSNVNVANELVNMIITQRAYELNSKAVTTSDQMLGRLTQM